MADIVTAEKGLGIRKQAFVKAYTDFQSATFGNAKRSYMVANPHVKENTAEAAACMLMKDDQIKLAIEDSIAIQGFNDVVVDKELFSVIKQKIELPAKVQAIKEYNKLRKRTDDGKGTNINIGFSLGALFEASQNVKEQSRRDVIDINLSEV